MGHPWSLCTSILVFGLKLFMLLTEIRRRICHFIQFYFDILFLLRKWKKLEVSGTAPAARSGCCMFPLADGGRVVVFGG